MQHVVCLIQCLFNYIEFSWVRTFLLIVVIKYLKKYIECTRQTNDCHISQDSFYKWTKISSLEIDIFGLKMMVKSGLEFFILKFTEPLQRCLLTCQANSAFLGKFFCTATLKGLGEFQNKNFQTTFHHHFSIKNINFKTRYFSPLIK